MSILKLLRQSLALMLGNLFVLSSTAVILVSPVIAWRIYGFEQAPSPVGSTLRLCAYAVERILWLLANAAIVWATFQCLRREAVSPLDPESGTSSVGGSRPLGSSPRLHIEPDRTSVREVGR